MYINNNIVEIEIKKFFLQVIFTLKIKQMRMGFGWDYKNFQMPKFLRYMPQLED